MNAQEKNEVMQLRTAFLRNQFGIATEQSKQMSGGIASPGGGVAKTTHAAVRLMAAVIEAIALA